MLSYSYVKGFATLTGRELEKGQIIKRGLRFLEILSLNHIQRGEGQGTHIEALDVQTLGHCRIHIKSKETVNTAELSSIDVEVESFDRKKDFLIVSTSNYERLEIPSSFAPWAKGGVCAGVRLKIVMDEDKFVKLTLPVNTQIRKG